MTRLALPGVTLCAATSVNVAATIWALQECLRQIEFAECLLFTNTPIPQHDSNIRVLPVARMASAHAYSEFLLTDLVDFVETSHCLVVQWDGFILDAKLWDPSMLDYDYIGAPWPQFDDGHEVGNGGFSLRSRRLLEACRDPRFRIAHPEDIAICRLNRDLLEREHGMRFADRAAAELFSFERAMPNYPTLGFHGVFNLIPVLGPDRFWDIYRTLDDKSTTFVDYGLLMRQLGSGRTKTLRRIRLTLDRVSTLIA